MKIIWSLFFTLFLSYIGAQPRFEETPLLRVAYQSIFELRLDQAQAILDESKIIDPDNYLVYHIENYIDFITLFIGEDQEKYEALLPNKSKRLSMIKKGDKNSPFYLFCQAEINLQWAILAGKFNEIIRFGLSASKAYYLLNENESLFPNFIHNQKTLSAIHALGETLPSWAKLVFSVKGSIKQGMEEIQEVIKYSETHNFIFKEESIAIHALILFHLGNKKEEAWETLNSGNLDPKESPIAAFLLANIGQKTGRNDEVIEILSQKADSDDRYPFYYLDYLLGKSKLNRLDKDADQHMLYFLKNFKGQHYIKEAYQKMAWYELVINNDYPSYRNYMRQCQSKGKTIIGSDIQANKEANGNFVPDPDLLKSRLYFDGGYLSKAYLILIKNGYKYAENASYQLEYYYRLARVLEARKNYPDAIQYYKNTIKVGADRPEYYACKSALQLGKILEHEKKYKQAVHYYNRCLEIEPIEYKSELHANAYAGLDRIKFIK